ncbi:MAG: 3'(2'),5'-bisphosphate nucleotidase CysQ [Pseudazoarcus pumilus]|nr:3'(2'),5'-bisphosphate nucleotidase CysQ [Pseudazoarcus pumilus]
MPDVATLNALLEHVVSTARSAGRVILDIYATDFEVCMKGDDSPVTAADTRAEAVIVSMLAQVTGDIPVVAEETAAAGQAAADQRFWLIDPLDGTREFISRNGEFTINIALIERGIPILGVVFAPALDRLFAGAIGTGAFVEEGGLRRSIHTRQPPARGLTVVASRSHGDPETLATFLQGYPISELKFVGSSLKLCLIAAGEADLYPRLGRTMEWDIAAGHAVLTAAGGQLYSLTGEPLYYGKAGFENPHFIARGSKD